MSDRSPTPRRALFALLALGGLATLGTAVAATQAGGADWRAEAQARGWHHRAVSVEEAQERVAWGADQALDRVDATDAQREAAHEILADAVPEGFALKADGRALKADLRDALLQPEVSPDAVESIRQDGLDLADRASAQALDVVVELAQLLTVEQRQELDDTARSWRRSGPKR